MRPGYYLATGLVVFMFVSSVIAFYHFKADRWGVFASDFESFHQRIDINKLYLKTRFLVKSEHDYTCFVIGSSRVAAINAKLFGERCYNFTHSGGLVVDHLRAIETILDSGSEVSEVYLALDDLSYNEDPQLGNVQHMRRAYPVSLFEQLDFLRLFLLKPLDVIDLSLVTGRNPKVRTPRFILDPDLDTGRIRSRYQKFFDEPRKTDIRFRRLAGTGEGSEYFGSASMNALRSLKKLSSEHNFSLQAFFMPLHYKTYLTRDYGAWQRFKNDVVQILPFRDFSGLNKYTTDNRYWRETSHFSAVVGDRIALGVMSGRVGEAGLGRLATSETIRDLERDQLNTDLEIMPLLLRREGLMHMPPRYRNRWRSLSVLTPEKVLQSDVSANKGALSIAASDSISIRRGDDGTLRRSGAVLSVRKGDYFTLEYEFTSRHPGQFRLQLEQDESQYEGRFREFRLRVKPGLNRGLFAGYASVDHPEIKLMLGGGDIDIKWRPLVVEKIHLDKSAKQRAELFNSEYGLSRGGILL